MTDWINALVELQATHQAYVLVTILAVRGSAPRNAGSKMVVTKERTYASIGGGQLEHHAIERARALLQTGQNQQVLESFILGADLAQCCGGQIAILLESFVEQVPSVAVFGAGHVAKALVPILAQLPLRVVWLDNRVNMFPDHVPDTVEVCLVADLPAQVARFPAQSYYLILTHSHDLDFALVDTVLKRGDSAYLGVIGSQTKARRFRQRLQQQGFNLEQLNHLHCPMGLVGLNGKLPMEVAVAIAAELMRCYQQKQVPSGVKQGVAWDQVRELTN